MEEFNFLNHQEKAFVDEIKKKFKVMLDLEFQKIKKGLLHKFSLVDNEKGN